MSFFWPSMLVFLILIPLLVGGYFLMQRRRQRAVEKFGSLGWMQADQPGMRMRRHIPALIFLLSLTILILSLARPKAPMSLPRVEGTVILVFDVSGSMAADDLNPTRMEAAKAAASEFVKRQPPGVQVGVVAFSDGGLTVQVPTNDQEAILKAISRLAPQRGTSLAGGIFAALDLVSGASGEAPLTPVPSPTPMPPGQYSPAVIVLLTDGENNMNPDPLEAAQAAADLGVRIHSIGIGSASGATLTINDFIVHTSLDEQTLKGISTLTDGTYFNAQSEADFQKIYESIEPQLVIKTEDMEVTSIFAGAAMLLLLAGGLFSMLWFNRIP
jgi:Ca-activated chloride channel family protein